MAEPREEWGRLVRARRESLGLRQEDVAEDARIDQGFLSKVERGQTGVSFDVKVRIAKALDSSPADLFPYPQAAAG